MLSSVQKKRFSSHRKMVLSDVIGGVNQYEGGNHSEKYKYQINTMDTSNSYNIVCQLYLNKAEGQKGGKYI